MNRSGTYVNNLTGEALYKSFRPATLPPSPVLGIDDSMIAHLVEANRYLVQLDTASRFMDKSNLFVSMYVRKEALMTSQIEGTQCILDDILDPEIDQNINNDVSEVINYVKAAQYAMERLNTLPLCNRLLKETHAILMEGARGQDKSPGEFRRSQNWIGPANSTLNEARFVPPNVNDMTEAMSSLEKYINENNQYDPLIQAALVHYQFETIHPFLDGNGRIGRLLILLYLIEQKRLSKPILYVSYFLKKNQIEYYDRMSEVRTSGNYEQWVKFFLEAVKAAAKDAIETIERLSSLHSKNIALLPKSNRKKDNYRLIFDYLQQHPIIDIGKTAVSLHVTYNTVSSVVSRLVKLGILRESTNASRNKVFTYTEYLDILRKDT